MHNLQCNILEFYGVPMSFKDAEMGTFSLFYKYPLKYVPIPLDVLVDECFSHK